MGKHPGTELPAVRLRLLSEYRLCLFEEHPTPNIRQTMSIVNRNQRSTVESRNVDKECKRLKNIQHRQFHTRAGFWYVQDRSQLQTTQHKTGRRSRLLKTTYKTRFVRTRSHTQPGSTPRASAYSRTRPAEVAPS